MRKALESYRRDGWAVFAPDAAMSGWARGCAEIAKALLSDPAQERWYRCDRTWFAGVNVLPNDAAGAVSEAGLPALSGAAVSFIRDALGFKQIAWDAAQISVVFPGYPRHGVEDTEASFRFRRNRFAAHVDGLERFGPDRRRRLNETHSVLLGIPLADHPLGASPFVIWRGSHEIMRTALRDVLGAVPRTAWFETDITDAYVAARKRCFEECEAVPVTAPLGGAYVMHPLALHGVAPWEAATAAPRAVAYFRPDLFGGDPKRWLSA